MPTKSGMFWVAWANVHATASRNVEDLAEPFRSNARAFIKALRDAGARVNVMNTLRSPQRAYLFHWCWRIAQRDATAEQADADPMPGVDIRWNHGTALASWAGAAEMVAGFGLAVPPQSTNPPAKSTNHTKGLAIDMVITWSGAIEMKRGDNAVVTIPFRPNVNANPALHAAGASYGVYKLLTDAPHWSHNGR
jgi:hypothetical protein